jgi:hypothetical protein
MTAHAKAAAGAPGYHTYSPEPCKPEAAPFPSNRKPGLKAPQYDDDDEGEESFSTHSSSTTSINRGRAFGHGQPARMDAAPSGPAGKRSNVIQGQTKKKVWTPGTVSEERKQRWASLLYDRPEERNEDDMSHWLLSVLQVSDPATSVPSMSSSTGANESGGAANTGSGSTNNGSSSNLGSSTGTSRGPEDGSGDTGSGGSREQSSSSSHTSDEAPSHLRAKRTSAIGEALTPTDKRRHQEESPDEAT